MQEEVLDLLWRQTPAPQRMQAGVQMVISL